MSGSIVRALNWDVGVEQRFIAVNPLGDEVVLYQTHHRDAAAESNDIVKVASCGGFDNIQCCAYSPVDVGLAAVGQTSGIVSVFDVAAGGGTALHLKPKQPRQCNAVCFNAAGLVAAGFDKGRQDNLLQLWNIEHFLRTANDHLQRPLYLCIPNEAVVLAVFAPDRATNLVVGSYKFLREVDLRQDAPVFQLATRCTLGVAVDPFRPHLVLAYAEDGSYLVWDRRKLAPAGPRRALAATEAPLLLFARLFGEGKKRGPWVRHSTIRPGEFAAVFNGDLIRRWNTGVVPPREAGASGGASGAASAGASPAAALKAQAALIYRAREESLFVSMVLDTKTEFERVILFDYSPDTTNTTLAHFVCMRQSGLVFRMLVRESVELVDFSCANDFVMGGPDGTLTHFAADAPAPPAAPAPEEEEEEDAEDSDDDYPLSNLLGLAEVVDADICLTMRQRAARGYGLDCAANVAVLEAHEALSHLVNTWKWLLLAKRAVDKGTMVQGVDLGYQGVLGIWKGAEELGGGVTDQSFVLAVDAIVAAKGSKTDAIHIPRDSRHKNRRKLCLLVAGWYLGDAEFDAKLGALVAAGMHEKAAGWAVFHGDVPRAIAILGAASKERLRIMLTAVAGYLAYRDLHVNSPWRDQCRKMALELANPYLRAIFAFIADNDWWDVLDELLLPLRERLGVALRFLSDRDLTVYLDRVAQLATTKGGLEGLVLTGVTPRAIALLQLYVNRTSDVQTAALVTAFACPRYFSDARAAAWTDAYRDLLNRWSMFSARARLDVGRTKLLRTATGKATAAPAPRQVYLQCARCSKSLAAPAPPPAPPLKFSRVPPERRALQACPHCGAPLPRCLVCLLLLGTPIADAERAGASDVENRFRQWFSFCLSCSHGAHAHHAEEWFSKHYVCPVPDCNCRCNSK